MHFSATVRSPRNGLWPLEPHQCLFHLTVKPTPCKQGRQLRSLCSTCADHLDGIQTVFYKHSGNLQHSQGCQHQDFCPAHGKDLQAKQVTSQSCVLHMAGSLPDVLFSRNIPETSSHALKKTAVLTTYKKAGNAATLFQPWKPHEKLYRQLSPAFPLSFIQANPKKSLARKRFAELRVINPGFH